MTRQGLIMSSIWRDSLIAKQFAQRSCSGCISIAHRQRATLRYRSIKGWGILQLAATRRLICLRFTACTAQAVWQASCLHDFMAHACRRTQVIQHTDAAHIFCICGQRSQSEGRLTTIAPAMSCIAIPQTQRVETRDLATLLLWPLNL